MRASQTTGFPASGSLLRGDASSFLQQIATDETLPELGGAASSFQGGEINSIEDLRQHVFAYQTNVLHPIEFSAAIRAWQLASQCGARELVMLDQELSRLPHLQTFAAASQRIGRIHLKRLRPLRDQRVVQRYLAAIDRGDARGWHMIVYGLILFVYSIPLRQGLIHYGCASVRGLLNSGSAHFRGPQAAVLDLEDEAVRKLPSVVGHAIALSGAEGAFSPLHPANSLSV